jgi:hypothetical protein
MTVAYSACGESWSQDPAWPVPCPVCGRSVGQGCVRPSSHPYDVHGARDRLAFDTGLLRSCPGSPA